MDTLAPIINALHAEGRLRVWSLVITVFGDSVQHRGGRIATARLRVLLGRIGVEPGALRTALSRLGNDGWVRSERNGRASTYTLTAQGRAKFIGATEAIYAAPLAAPEQAWTLRLGGPGPGLSPAPGLWLEPASRATGRGGDLAVTGALSRVGPELAARLIDPQQRADRQALADDIAALTDAALDPLAAAAARTLLIHRWRRLVLRYPEIPPELLPGDPTAGLRADVARLYRVLTPLAEAWLDSGEDGLEPMPPADPPATARFA